MNKLLQKIFKKKEPPYYPTSKDKLDEIIEFYYPGISDMQRFHMRAMATSWGKDCFYAGQKTFTDSRGGNVYPQYIDYIKDIRQKK